MKRLIVASASILFLGATLNVVSCSIQKDPFLYLPQKTNMTHSYFVSNEIQIIGFKNKEKLDVDYSPMLSFALKTGGSGNFGNPKYEEIYNQFIDEFEYFNHFNKSDNSYSINYILNSVDDVNSIIQYEKTSEDDKNTEELVDMNQIIRIDNYSKTPGTVKDGLVFKDIVLRKWTFEYSSKDWGIYIPTESTTKITIFINDISFEQLTDEKNTENIKIINVEQ